MDAADVTPFMGVWIEIPGKRWGRLRRERSHPLWVCGLKLIMK